MSVFKTCVMPERHSLIAMSVFKTSQASSQEARNEPALHTLTHTRYRHLTLHTLDTHSNHYITHTRYTHTRYTQLTHTVNALHTLDTHSQRATHT